MQQMGFERSTSQSEGMRDVTSFAGETMSALESLAAWKEMEGPAMARMLIDMTAQQRTELRYQYAAAFEEGPSPV